MIGDDGDTEEFFKAILPYQEAVNLLIVYCKHQDQAMLKQLYKAYGRYLEYGQMYVKDAYASTTLEDRMQLLGYAETIFATGASKTAAKSLKLQEIVSPVDASTDTEALAV